MTGTRLFKPGVRQAGLYTGLGKKIFFQPNIPKATSDAGPGIPGAVIQNKTFSIIIKHNKSCLLEFIDNQKFLAIVLC